MEQILEEEYTEHEYPAVWPAYKPPKQAQSIYSYYETLDRYTAMLIWWENLIRLKESRPRVKFKAIEHKREFAQMSKYMRSRII